MPVIISDETLKAAGLDEKEARIEIACRLFDADKLHLGMAAKLAGLRRDDFEAELVVRGIPIYRIDSEYLHHELEMSRKA
jgi:predicted HTH domain antitoxin